VVDLDYPPFLIDRVEDAVAPSPQTPQIRRPVREAHAVIARDASTVKITSRSLPGPGPGAAGWALVQHELPARYGRRTLLWLLGQHD